MSRLRSISSVSLFTIAIAAILIGFSVRIPVNAIGKRTAATFHVAMSGDDANDGSAQSPWATLQHAANEADAAGDIVLVENGNYAGFNSQHDGITFQANGDSVIVDVAGSYSGLDNINIENNNDVVVAGFIVRGAPRAGIRIVNADRVVVRNNKVGPNGKWGIFSGFATDIEVLYNITFGSAEEHGIYLSNSRVPDDNVTVRGNISYGNQVNGIQLNGDCFADGDGMLEGGVIESNYVYDNGAKGLSIISAPAVRIQNNVIYNNHQEGIGAAGIHLVDEPGCGKPTNTAIVVNNTIHEPEMAGIRINDGASDNLIFNNLIVSTNPIVDEVGTSIIDDVSNITAASAAGLLLDVSGEDYHLAAASAAIDAGLTVFNEIPAPSLDIEGSDRNQGIAPDAGAYEHRAGASVDISRTRLPVDHAVLDAAFPNPFSRSASLRFVSANGLPAQVQLYDTRGRLVKVLYQGSPAPQEFHQVEIDGTGLASGLYHVRFEEEGGAFMSRPVMLVR